MNLKNLSACLFLFFLAVLITPFTSLVNANDLANGRAPVQDEIVIGIRVVPPFVIHQSDGSYSGLSIELWEVIADELDLQYRYEERDLEDLLSGLQEGSLFASVSALTITSEREESVDFTHPFFITGLGIAVAHKPAGLLGAVLSLFSTDFLWVVLLLLLLLLFWGFLVWIFERNENRDEFGGSPAQGIGSGFWWAAVTMTTVGYGDKSPRSLGGRIVGFVWMFTAIIVISFFTASIASSLTVTQLDSRVSGPGDLPNVQTGALSGSATVGYLEDIDVRPVTFSTIEEGLIAVENEQIDAFVHDAPILRYHTRNDFQGEVRVLPNSFNEQYYGIALPLNSEYRNEINRVLLEFIQSERWEELNNDYMGEL